MGLLEPNVVSTVAGGGRYANDNMTEAAKHPHLIPKNSQLAKLIVKAVH